MCDICNKNGSNDDNHGGIRTKGNISAHYFCLLLSPDLPQKGRDCDGILGFLNKDIRSLISLTRDKKCCYCNEIGASVKCSSCPVYFHVLCGIEHKCRFRFIGEFNSYCHQHHNISHNKQHSNDYLCFVCLQKMGEYHPISSIMPKCCNSGWMHLSCVKKYAFNAGYYLKCLLCASPDFRDEARELSIFVPDRDAIWEMEKGAYAGLHTGYSRCDADQCLCPSGRKYENTRWQIIVCSTCGASGTHSHCTKHKLSNKDKWLCKGCEKVLSETKEHSKDMSFEYSLYFTKSQLLYAEQCSFERLSQSQSNNDDSLQSNRKEPNKDISTNTDREHIEVGHIDNPKNINNSDQAEPVLKMEMIVYDGTREISRVDIDELIDIVMDPNFVDDDEPIDLSPLDNISDPIVHVKEISAETTLHTFYDSTQDVAHEFVIKNNLDVEQMINSVMNVDPEKSITLSDSDTDVCSTCGASGTHSHCTKHKLSNKDKWLCKGCEKVLSETKEHSKDMSFEYSLYFTKSQLLYAEQCSFERLSQSQSNNDDSLQSNRKEPNKDISTNTDREHIEVGHIDNPKNINNSDQAEPVLKMEMIVYDGTREISRVDIDELIDIVMDPNFVDDDEPIDLSPLDNISDPIVHVKEISAETTLHTFYDSTQDVAHEFVIKNNLDVEQMINSVMNVDPEKSITLSDSDTDVSELFNKM